MPDCLDSVSDIQDYIEYIIKNHEILPKYYINRIKNRLLFKIRAGYKAELKTPETLKLFGSIKRLIDKTKNGENVLSLGVVEVVLVHSNLVDNQYQQKSEVL